VMPFLVKALLEKRARYEAMAKAEGLEAVAERDAKARGYLRPREGYRLFDKREPLLARLGDDVRANAEWLKDTLGYPLAATL